MSVDQATAMMVCGECDGAGGFEDEVPRPHANGFNMGYVDHEWVGCEDCGGTGEVERLCPACGYEMSKDDAAVALVCSSCREEEVEADE